MRIAVGGATHREHDRDAIFVILYVRILIYYFVLKRDQINQNLEQNVTAHRSIRKIVWTCVTKLTTRQHHAHVQQVAPVSHVKLVLVETLRLFSSKNTILN